MIRRRLLTLGLTVLAAGGAGLVAPPPASAARPGYDSLLAPGAGFALPVCQVCLVHGLAGIVPSGAGGFLTSVTLNLGGSCWPACTAGGDGIVEVHQLDQATGGPGTLLGSVSTPVAELPHTPAYVDIVLPEAIRVRRGQPLVIVLAFRAPEGQGGFEAYAKAATEPRLLGFSTGVWQSLGLAELQVATHLSRGRP